MFPLFMFICVLVLFITSTDPKKLRDYLNQ